jgi:serine/threonine protein kinase
MLIVESTVPSSHRSYLLTEAIENSTTLAEFFGRHWPAMKGDERARWLTRHSRQLARQLRRMHESGFDHRDLKFPNLLVSNDESDDRTWLLDLDAVRAWPVLPRMRAMQNLSRLNVSSLLVAGLRHTDRLRFLRWYLGSAFAAEWKRWWRRIVRRSLLKIDRNHRDSRPLS